MDSRKQGLFGLSILVAMAVGGSYWFYTQKTTQKNLSSRDPLAHNLLTEIQRIHQDLLNPQVFNLNTCVTYIESNTLQAHKLGPDFFYNQDLKRTWKESYLELWGIRQTLREKLADFIQENKNQTDILPCANSVREALRTTRYIEDYLGELFSGAKEFNQDKDPKALGTLQGETPTLMLAGSERTLKIRSGDVITSRGNAYTSAAISRIGKHDSQFSHAAFIYIEGNGTDEMTIEEAIASERAYTLEAHIEVGSRPRKFRDYLKDGNYRNVVFRYQDPQAAHQAAKASFDYLNSYIQKSFKKHKYSGLDDVNHNIPYDFGMDMSDAQEIFCSEVVSFGFGKTGAKIPYFLTELERKNDLVKRLGIKVKATFAPGDLEIDPRFKMIAEYRDFRKSKSIRMKDAVLVAMFRWMNKYNYRIEPDAKSSVKALVAWVGRQTDLAFKTTLPKNMNMKVLRTVMTLDQTAEVLEKHLRKKENEYFRQKGLLIPFKDAQLLLEDYRKVDFQKFSKGESSDFHFWFNPK